MENLAETSGRTSNEVGINPLNLEYTWKIQPKNPETLLYIILGNYCISEKCIKKHKTINSKRI